MSNNSTNINKTTYHLKPLNIKKTMTNDIGNPDPGLGQAQQYSRVKQVNGIPTLSS
jgi:hypothetical protein